MTRNADVVVVGGGIAGLAAAALIARAGRDVCLIERASAVGGRAATQRQAGFSFNLGPHALYFGAAREVLADLGVPFTGKKAPTAGAFAFEGGALHTLPVGFLSLVSTGLLGLGAKYEVARLLQRLPSLPAAEVDSISVAEWLDEHTRDATVRRLLEALIRVSTYTDDPARLSAGLALRQVQSATTLGVTYVDGGWQVLADGLAAAATKAGARILTETSAASVLHGSAVTGVRLTDGSEIAASRVILAGTPRQAHHLVPASAQLATAAAALTVEVGCLDLALSSLPRPRHLFAMGLDRPLYFSVHSATARLAEPGAALVHVAKYLRPGAARSDEQDLREMEELTDLMQPGWRELLVERRVLPRMPVYHHLPLAKTMGLAGRPSPSVAEIAGLFVAGDWVGQTGMLADAALASARACAEAILDENGAAARAKSAIASAQEARGSTSASA